MKNASEERGGAFVNYERLIEIATVEAAMRTGRESIDEIAEVVRAAAPTIFSAGRQAAAMAIEREAGYVITNRDVYLHAAEIARDSASGSGGDDDCPCNGTHHPSADNCRWCKCHRKSPVSGDGSEPAPEGEQSDG